MKRRAKMKIDWPTVAAKFYASGLSQAEFARQNNMNGPTLSGGLMALKKSGKKFRKTNGHLNGNGHGNGFVQVGASQMMELITKKGITIKVPVDINPMTLRNVMSACSDE